MKKLLLSLLTLSTLLSVSAADFTSFQLASTTLTNGYILQTNGRNNKWVATSSLGFASGGEVTYAYASSTFPSFTYGSSTYLTSASASSTYATGTNYWGGTLGGSVYNLNTGSIGIGTTTPTSYANGGTLLDITSASNPGITIHGGKQEVNLISNNGVGAYLDVLGATTASNNFLSFRTTNTASSYSTTNTERMRITSAGLVGIGTTTPAAKLDVQGTNTSVGVGSNIFRVQYTDANAADSGAAIGFYGATAAGGNKNMAEIAGRSENSGDRSYLQFATNGTGGILERMRIDSIGNVGIGTSTLPSGVRLTVVSSLTDANTEISRTVNPALATSGRQVYQTIGRSANPGDAAVMGYQYGTTAATQLAILGIYGSALTSDLLVDGNGNVAIGTTSPTARLHMGNNTSASTASPINFSMGGTYVTTAGTNLKLKVWENGTDAIGLGVSTGALDIVSGLTTGVINFYTNGLGGTAKMILNSSGNLGIGTTTPVDKLQVAGNATPSLNITYGLGSSTQRWLGLYVRDIFASTTVTTTASTTSIFSTNATTTNLSYTSATGTNAFFTNATATRLFATNGTTTNFWVTATTTLASAVGIGTTTFTANSAAFPELVKISSAGMMGASTNGATPLSSYCSISGYCQVAVTNSSLTGTSTEAGFTAQNASSTATTSFAWFGINGVAFAATTSYSTGRASDVTLIARGNDFYIANASTTGSIFFQTGGTGTSTATTTKMTLTSLGNFGFGTSSPVVTLSVATGSVAIFPYLWGTATSTSMTIDWRRSNNQTIEISTAAVTLNMINSTSSPGQKLILNVCNAPTGTAGAITWTSSLQIRWVGKTVPTQTTTANNCDKYSFDANYGTSSQVIIYGAQSANF